MTRGAGEAVRCAAALATAWSLLASVLLADSGSMSRPTTRERRFDSRVKVEEGQCPIQDWIASRFERGHNPITSRFNWDKKVKGVVFVR